MESLLTTALCGFARITPDLEIQHANGPLAVWLGYEGPELAHMPLEKHLNLASWHLLRDELAPRALAQRGPVQERLVLLHHSGEEVPVLASLSRLEEAPGSLAAVFVRLPPDLNPPATSGAATAKVVNSEHAQKLSQLSHELRSPLQSISLTTYVLLDEDQGPINEAQREDLQRIQRAAQEVSRLINEILGLMR